MSRVEGTYVSSLDMDTDVFGDMDTDVFGVVQYT